MTSSFLQQESDRLKNSVQTNSLILESFSETAWEQRPAPGKWSKKEELGHLIDSAANNHLRFVRAQLADQEFISFAYEQNFFVSFQNYAQRAGADILQLWKAYNLHLAHVMRNINPAKLDIICKIGSYEPVTLKFIVEDYNDHLQHHLAKILAR